MGKWAALPCPWAGAGRLEPAGLDITARLLEEAHAEERTEEGDISAEWKNFTSL